MVFSATFPVLKVTVLGNEHTSDFVSVEFKSDNPQTSALTLIIDYLLYNGFKYEPLSTKLKETLFALADLESEPVIINSKTDDDQDLAFWLTKPNGRFKSWKEWLEHEATCDLATFSEPYKQLRYRQTKSGVMNVVFRKMR